MTNRERQSGRPAGRRISRKELAARRQRYADMQWLMANPAGRRLVWGWLEDAGVYRQTFSPNALEMAFAEGKRYRGNELLTEVLAYASEHYLQMTREHSPTAAALLKDEIDDDEPES